MYTYRSRRDDDEVPSPFWLLYILALLFGTAVCLHSMNASAQTIDLRPYFPDVAQDNTYYRPDGSLYVRRVTTPASFLGAFVRDDYLAKSYWSKETVFDNRWHFVHRDDTAVIEVADSWIGRTQVYAPDGIFHARPGGHRVGEDWFYAFDQEVVDSKYTVWSAVRVEAVLPKYVTQFGHVFNDVVVQLFAHGTSGPGGECPAARPAWAGHVTGHVSFWTRRWLAPGVGEVAEEILFDERTCAGTASVKNASPLYSYSIGP